MSTAVFRSQRSATTPALGLAATLVLVMGCRGSSGDDGGNLVPAHPDALGGLPTEAPPPDTPIAPAGGRGGDTASAPGGVVPSITSKAATYRVGPGLAHPTLASVVGILEPGDVVDLTGDTTYHGGVHFTRSGCPDAKIVIRGVAQNGKRPILAGGQNTIEVEANHYVFEGLEITGGTRRCFYHHGHDVTLRDSFVHDCPQQGILGADEGSGSFTLEFTEIARAGGGLYHHPIYMATDERAHPGSVFRMEHCYVHDGGGGNNLKSRAERNEIRYNWIEGAKYHEVELIGPDGQDPKLAREDSEIVGNVLRKTSDFHALRLGGDGTGDTNGRYRLVNNTIIVVGAEPALRLFDGIESVELFNNAFFRVGGGKVALFKDSEAKWATGARIISGANNWLPDGSEVPPTLKTTRFGSDPRFGDIAKNDLRPGSSSPLEDAGTSTTTGGPMLFPNPLAQAAFEPPVRALAPAKARAPSQRPAIGAFEP